MNIAQVITFSEANETWGNFANLFLQNTPPILVQRFMLNLREFNSAESAEGNSDFEHFSRFSVSFRVPSGFMGNIGQPLDHGQLPELCEDDGDIDNEWVSANMDMYGSERSPSSSTHSGAA
ncbi:hypothetical protein PsYK624_154650 [Phanerochaete sordida]|uniref:Uncharacterized protein n=1 Tax=Phanerochaete sordida TaxID=48140 RepID=A0A9P3GQB6_9APHY|nr:hypothetical protein PsYK624_154650 [Phanerochaete sordida]